MYMGAHMAHGSQPDPVYFLLAVFSGDLVQNTATAICIYRGSKAFGLDLTSDCATPAPCRCQCLIVWSGMNAWMCVAPKRCAAVFVVLDCSVSFVCFVLLDINRNPTPHHTNKQSQTKNTSSNNNGNPFTPIRVMLWDARALHLEVEDPQRNER